MNAYTLVVAERQAHVEGRVGVVIWKKDYATFPDTIAVFQDIRDFLKTRGERIRIIYKLDMETRVPHVTKYTVLTEN